MLISIDSFISGLKNFEKSRNKNVFTDYSLDSFYNTLDKFHLLERKFSSKRIGIVGTNGKGSTAHFLKEIALSANLVSTAGLYTSPHLIHRNERIKVNRINITDEWMQLWLTSLEDYQIKLLKELSFFEFYTLVCFQFFETSKVLLQIYEAGLGGRLDATRLAHPDYVVITKIGIDHEAILGNTKEKILLEKLGIISENTKSVFYISGYDSNLDQIIQDYCTTKKIKSYGFPQSMNIDYLEFNFNFAKFILNNVFKLDGSNSNLIADNFNSPKGRMEVISKSPLVVYDTAHNPDAVIHLLNSIQLKFGIKNFDVIIGALKDKDIDSMLKILINESNIEKIFLLSLDNFATSEIISPKLVRIETLGSIKNYKNNLLIIGSFRIYEMLCDN